MRQKTSATILVVLLLVACAFAQQLQQQGILPGSYLIPVEDCSAPAVNRYFLADTLKEERAAEEYRPAYNLGSCTKLKGHQVVALFFIDDSESTWTAEDVRHFTNSQVLPGLVFLRNQAKRWGVELSFSVNRYSVPLSSDGGIAHNGTLNRETLYENGGWKFPSKLFNSWGFPSALYMLSNLLEETDGSPVIPLFILNKSERSFAWKQSVPGKSSFLEHCIIYAANKNQATESWKFNTYTSSTIAHEILHLFGAEDYYYEKGESRDHRSILAKQNYLNDIMLCYYDDLHLLSVNDVTAYSIGWTDRIPEILYNEDWYR